jgi:NAD+ synthase
MERRVSERVSRHSDDSKPTLAADEIPNIHEQLVSFVGTIIDEADADRAVLVLDGGVATAVLATLATDALGAERVEALVMPAHLSSEAAAQDAERIATTLKLEPHRIQLQPLLAAFREAVGVTSAPTDDIVAVQNALVRFRMACAYYVANTGNGLVFGSATRTERLLGSVTKHGNTGVDVLPFGDLYRTEVRMLADELSIPDNVTATLRNGFSVLPTNAEELGVDSQTLDEILVAVMDAQQPPDVVAEEFDINIETVKRVIKWHAATSHKRRQPQTPNDLV